MYIYIQESPSPSKAHAPSAATRGRPLNWSALLHWLITASRAGLGSTGRVGRPRTRHGWPVGRSPSHARTALVGHGLGGHRCRACRPSPLHVAPVGRMRSCGLHLGLSVLVHALHHGSHHAAHYHTTDERHD